MKTTIHSLIFDGTSYYVVSQDEAKELVQKDSDYELINESYDFDFINDEADRLNEEMYLNF